MAMPQLTCHAFTPAAFSALLSTTSSNTNIDTNTNRKQSFLKTYSIPRVNTVTNTRNANTNSNAYRTNSHHGSFTILCSTKEQGTADDISSSNKGNSSNSSNDSGNDNGNGNDKSKPVFEDVDGIGETTIQAGIVNDILVDIIKVSPAPDQQQQVQVQQQVQQLKEDGIVTITDLSIDEVQSSALQQAENQGIVDILPISQLQQQQLKQKQQDDDSDIDSIIVIDNKDDIMIDPSAVVEAVIGTALDNHDKMQKQNLEGVDTSSTPTTDTATATTTATPTNEETQLLLQVVEESVPPSSSAATTTNAATTSTEEEEEIEIPNLNKIIKFAIPAIGVWLCSPLLSLIDTSSVGLLSGTAQQAALNPAVAVTDYAALLVAFMYTATTNLVAGSKGGKEHATNENNNTSNDATNKTLINALQLSGYVGTILGTVLIALGPTFLKAIIGNDSIDPNVYTAALRYVRIRALGMPAAVIIGSAQSACLGLQDIKSPMYVLLAAAIVNFLGDVIFVPMSHAWLGGAAGAAWATVFSQYAALAMFTKWLISKPKKNKQDVEQMDQGQGGQQPIDITKQILELTGKSVEGKSRRKNFRKALRKLSHGAESSPSFQTNKKVKEKEFTVRGMLAGQQKKLFSMLSLKEAKMFWPYFIPVTATQIGRISAFISMSHTVSSSLGTLSMAANQIILSVFYCLTPIADSLNLTAQSFLPAITQKRATKARADAIRQLSIQFVKGGLLFSVGMVGAVNCIPFFSKYFTSDPSVIALVNSNIPALSGIFATHGIVCALEGEFYNPNPSNDM